MKNYWIDNYTIEGAVKQLQEWLETWTIGSAFASNTAIIDLWDEFFVTNPQFEEFEEDIDLDWDGYENKDGTYWFTNIKVWSDQEDE